jgi:rubrerythrin
MDRMASIELALKNEKTEMEFYQNESKRSRNPLAAAMFESLARDEEEHMRRIAVLHDKLVAKGSWPKNMPIEVRGTNVRQVLDEMVQKVGSKQEHSDDDVKALEKAITFEAKGTKFYADLAASCVNPMEKNLFEFLSQIEREHHLSLTDSLEYLKNPEDWMKLHERSLLDGA